jgi:hypothetical protein
MQCTKCHSDGKLSRTKRVGLFEEHIYPFFGYFPWICSLCKRRILIKDRGDRKRLPFVVQSTPPPSPGQNRNGLHQVQ